MMWSTLNWSPVYRPLRMVAAWPRLISSRPAALRQPNFPARSRFSSMVSTVSFRASLFV